MAYLAAGAAILVTGGTGGIGSEIARQAAAGGAIVGIHGSRDETVGAVVDRLRAEYPEARLIGLPGDIREDGVIEAVVAEFAAQAGRIDAVVHCMTTGAPGTIGLFAGMTPENFSAMAALALGTVQRLAFAALPYLRREGGAFVVFASDAGRFAAPRQSVLGAAFGGIMAFVRNLSVELAREGVRVHCISPSYVAETPVFERVRAAGRAETAAQRAGLGLPTPKDIAPIVLFLCGPDAAKITGQVISINGGLHA